MQKKNWTQGFGWRWAASTGSNIASMEHHFFAECSGEKRGGSLCGNGRGGRGTHIYTHGFENGGELRELEEGCVVAVSFLYVCSSVLML